MKTSRVLFVRLLGIAVLLTGMAGCVEMQTGAGSAASKNGSTAPAASERVSSGTQGDTLEACLQRIPSDATSGQRMLAKQSCQRDEAARQSIQAVPGN